MGGVGGGFEMCRRAARRANLSGEWVPWLSGSGEDAIGQLPADVPYERLDRRRVVSRASDLTTGALLAPIEITENGTLVERQDGTAPPANDSQAFVWTGTLANGRDGQLHCRNWSSFEDMGILGSASRIDAAWTMIEPIFTAPDSPRGCAFSAHLYCFER